MCTIALGAAKVDLACLATKDRICLAASLDIAVAAADDLAQSDAAIEQSVRSAKASGKRVAAVGQVGRAHQIVVGDELEVVGHRS